jgi:hypothetical protein
LWGKAYAKKSPIRKVFAEKLAAVQVQVRTDEPKIYTHFETLWSFSPL